MIHIVHRTARGVRCQLEPDFMPCERSSCIFSRRPTVCVTRWWVGRDNATLTEPTSSHAKCLKTRKLPPVGCTLCWAAVSWFSSLCFININTTRNKHSYMEKCNTKIGISWLILFYLWLTISNCLFVSSPIFLVQIIVS